MLETPILAPLPAAPAVRLDRPPGVVGVIAQDTARFSAFAVSLTGVSVPAGTTIKWIMGHAIAAQANLLVRALLEEAAPDSEWLWILGDDHAFAPDLLQRLVDVDADIVVPLCLTRNPPYKPVLFTGMEGVYRRRIDLNGHPGGGLVEVHSAGSAGMLIRRHVLEALDDPWFEAGVAATSVEIGEDFYFCDKARAAGFRIVANLDAELGHLTTATVWPALTEGGWTYGFDFPGGMRVTMPSNAWEAADAAAS